eukprot:3051183-Amphidinium_carterae.1
MSFWGIISCHLCLLEHFCVGSGLGFYKVSSSIPASKPRKNYAKKREPPPKHVCWRLCDNSASEHLLKLAKTMELGVLDMHLRSREQVWAWNRQKTHVSTSRALTSVAWEQNVLKTL